MFTNRKVVPSYLGSRMMGENVEATTQGHAVNLMLGEIKEIIPPDSPHSLSKKYLEYNVDVQWREGMGPTSIVKFTNCLLINTFGAVADKLDYTLRVDQKKPTGKNVTTKGAKVLVLCLNGSANTAYIIGGIREDKGGDVNEHALSFEFNGVQVDISSEGELQIRHRGPTTIEGELQNPTDLLTEGSTIVFDKDGGIELATKDKSQYVFLNNKDKKIDILADDQWHVKVNGQLSFETGKDISIKTASTCELDAAGKVSIQSAGVNVGLATEAWMMGTSYRAQEGIMHTAMSSTLASLAGLVTAAAGNLQAASAALKISASAASAPMQAAATALTTAGPLFGVMASAIIAFESQAIRYLSLKNKND